MGSDGSCVECWRKEEMASRAVPFFLDTFSALLHTFNAGSRVVDRYDLHVVHCQWGDGENMLLRARIPSFPFCLPSSRSHSLTLARLSPFSSRLATAATNNSLTSPLKLTYIRTSHESAPGTRINSHNPRHPLAFSYQKYTRCLFVPELTLFMAV
jgi:hypothetical protein